MAVIENSTESVYMKEKKKNSPKTHPFADMDPEKLKEISAKGGKASAEKRMYNRTFKQAMEWALELPAVKGNMTVDKLRRKYPNLNNRDAMAIAMTAEAIQKQDVRAYLAIRDTTGELPEQTVNVKNETPIKITIETID